MGEHPPEPGGESEHERRRHGDPLFDAAEGEDGGDGTRHGRDVEPDPDRP